MSSNAIMPTHDRILVIGQNYKGTGMTLSGCHNDAGLYFRFFESKVTPETNPNTTQKIMWLDEPYLITKDGVLRALDWLLSSATVEQFLNPGILSFTQYPLLQNTRMFLAYAGHGTNVRGKVDRLDQVLVTSRGYVTDDEINQLFYTKMNSTSSLFGCIDSCSSGTIGDLRYCMNRPGKTIIDDNHTKNRIIPGRIQLISACNDNEQAAESENGGIFTLTVVEHLQRYPKSSTAVMYSKLYDSIMVWGQQPVITSNVPIARILV